MAISTSTIVTGGNFRCRLTLTSVDIGETLKYSMGGSSAGSAYYSIKTTTASTEYTAMKASVDAYITAQGSDGVWQYAFTADNGTSFDLLVPLSAGFIPGIATTPGGFVEITGAAVSISASGAFVVPSGTLSQTLESTAVFPRSESYTSIPASGSITFGSIYLIMRGTDNSYYGDLGYGLEPASLLSESYLYDSGSFAGTLSGATVFADGSLSTQKIGGLSTTLGPVTVPSTIFIFDSGIDGSVLNTLLGIPPGPISSGNFNTGGSVKYSLEWEMLHGLGNICLNREAFYDGIKQSGDCKVMVSASPISNATTDYYTSGCSCTKNVPFSITRASTGDITFLLQTYQGSSVITKSGISYMPGAQGTDYTLTSGNYTITMGNVSGVFPVPITAPTGYNYYFYVSSTLREYDSKGIKTVCNGDDGFTVYVNNGV